MENRQDVQIASELGVTVHLREAGGCLGFTGQNFYLKKQDRGCSEE